MTVGGHTHGLATPAEINHLSFEFVFGSHQAKGVPSSINKMVTTLASFSVNSKALTSLSDKNISALLEELCYSQNVQ